MNSPDRIANLGLTDDEIEAIALKHIAPGYNRLRAVVPEFAPYQQSEQFRRVKALLADALPKLRAPAADGWQPIDTAPSGVRVLLGPRETPVVGIVKRYEDPDSLDDALVCNVVHYNGTVLVAGYHCSEWAPLASAPVAKPKRAPVDDGIFWSSKEIQCRQKEEDEARAAYYHSRASAPVAGERAAFKKCHSAIIKALSSIARADGPDTRKADDPELLYRSPVMDDVVRIRIALDECSAALASAPIAGEAQPVAVRTRPRHGDGSLLSYWIYDDFYAHAPLLTRIEDERGIREPLYAAPQASAERLVRYCPGCGSVGPVEGEYRDCCPDGGEARMIPAPLAEKCRDTFKIAVKALRADAAANEAMANQVPAVTEEHTLRAMARNYTDRHSWDKLDSKAVTAAADEIRALRAAVAARASYRRMETPMTELASIPYPLAWADPQGRVWHLYSIEFCSPDGTYACHIYAISDEHAQLQLAALKETGRITGQTIGAFDA